MSDKTEPFQPNPALSYPKWWDALALNEEEVEAFLLTADQDHPRLSLLVSAVYLDLLPQVWRPLSSIRWADMESADLYTMLLGYFALERVVDRLLPPLPEFAEITPEVRFRLFEYWLCYEAITPGVSGLTDPDPMDRFVNLFAVVLTFALAAPLAEMEAERRLLKHRPGYEHAKYQIRAHFDPMNPKLEENLKSITRMVIKKLHPAGLEAMCRRYGDLGPLCISQTHVTLSKRFPMPESEYPAIEMLLGVERMNIAPLAIADDLIEHTKKDREHPGPVHQCRNCGHEWGGERKGHKCPKCGATKDIETTPRIVLPLFSEEAVDGQMEEEQEKDG